MQSASLSVTNPNRNKGQNAPSGYTVLQHVKFRSEFGDTPAVSRPWGARGRAGLVALDSATVKASLLPVQGLVHIPSILGHYLADIHQLKQVTLQYAIFSG